jgi:hypothetical protein
MVYGLLTLKIGINNLIWVWIGALIPALAW